MTKRKKLVFIYALRRLSRKGYIYVGSTNQPTEVRLRKHLTDAHGFRHSNKRLGKIIRESKNMVVMDILDICEPEDRDKKELAQILKLHNEKHRLTNIANPVNPRQKLPWIKK